jgi:hypothetical protein
LPRHLKRGRQAGRLSGFTTDNDAVIQNFREEIEVLTKTIIEEYQDKNKLFDYLQDLITFPK